MLTDTEKCIIARRVIAENPGLGFSELEKLTQECIRIQERASTRCPVCDDTACETKSEACGK